MNTPPRVSIFDPAEAVKRAQLGFIASFYGPPKTGKSHSVYQADGPLYIVHLDKNSSLDGHLFNRMGQGFACEKENYIIGPAEMPPLEVKNLTRKEAKDRIECIEDFARWSRAKSVQDREKGLPPGTFILDGGRTMEGWYEKFLLGFSATLGQRAERGERCVTHEGCDGKRDAECVRPAQQIQYGRPHNAMADFITAFGGGVLDLAMTWEAMEEWGDVLVDGKPKRLPTGWKTAMPNMVGHAVHVQTQTMSVRQDKKRKFKYIIDWVGVAGQAELFGGVLPATGFKMLKHVILSDIKEQEKALEHVDPETLVPAAVSTGLES